MYDEPLTEKNWRLYAAKNYQNPQSIGDEEFEQDLKRIKYVKKALTRYRTTGEIYERLVLNHLIVLYNVFGARAMCRLVFLKMADQLDLIAPFLSVMKVMPRHVLAVDGRDWDTREITMNARILEALRKI